MSLSHLHIYSYVDSFWLVKAYLTLSMSQFLEVCAQTTQGPLHCLWMQTSQGMRADLATSSASAAAHEACAQTLRGLRFNKKTRLRSVSSREPLFCFHIFSFCHDHAVPRLSTKLRISTKPKSGQWRRKDRVQSVQWPNSTCSVPPRGL